MPPATRTRTSAADVAALLVAAGRKILERDGVAKLTVRNVAAEAGVAPMGVYNHFDGKDGLLDAVVTDGFSDFTRMLTATDDDPRERLAASGRAYRRFALANPVLYSLMFSSNCEPDEAVAHGSLEVLVDTIRYGQLGGVIVPGDPYAVALRVWSCVHGAMSLELAMSYPPEFDADANFEGVIALIAKGLAPNQTD